MATKYLNLRGKLNWTNKLKDTDEYGGQTFWKVSLYDMDEESFAAFTSSGCRVKPKDDEGEQVYTFRRPTHKMIKGENVEFEPPLVVDAEGTPFDGSIGHGSEGIVNIAVYDTQMGKGHRLQGVKVVDLVEFVPDADSAGFATEKALDKSIFE